ncbi:uncharacterized protein LOC131317361 [Rhododendron vialii]|uniref:uncharacterized protein LOC131317361 n=1 Tax=Rhododendron vialii TaxID=182163 RepID=UPI00265FE6A7|nr:uncharacterized protein LOC131317361 [Rhododendron vialii]
MDKSWIHIRNRLDPTYIQGLEKFIEFAYDKKHPDSKIYCPCKKCVNLIFGTRSGVKEHLIINGFNTNYTRWTIQGKSLASYSRNESDANQSSYFQDDMIGMVHDAFGVLRQDGGIRDNEGLESMGLGPDKETKKFFKLLEDAQRELYPNCKTFTALSFTTHLLHIKVLGVWIDTSYDMLVELLRKAFPVRETLPRSFAEAKKFNEALGFSYEKIDACPKDCMLFWKDRKGLRNYKKCGTSRYKESNVFSNDGTAKLTQIPAKQPLIEELKELWIEGVLTFDASTEQMFRMQATTLMGTINDFLALAILSGWSTKGALACPSCNVETQSLWLKNFRKYCYMGHKHFLDQGHNFRKDAISFDGTIETRPRPLHLSGRVKKGG